MSKRLTIDARISAALSDDTISAEIIASLIAEAEAACAAADHAAEKERERSLDVSQTVDPAKVSETLVAIELGRDRLNAALPKLQAHYERARAAEYKAEWNDEYQRIEKERDKLAQELTATYPPLVTKLVDLFERIAEFDKEINHINGTAPRGENRRLLGAELKARGLDRFTTIQPALAKEVRLPHPGETSMLAWPPADFSFAVNAAQQVSNIMASRSVAYGPDWHEARKLDAELKMYEHARVDAQHERKREQEKKAYYEAQRVAEEYRRTGNRP